MATVEERGFFWWFNEPEPPANCMESAVPGLLTIADSGNIRLEVDDHICREKEDRDWLEPQTFPGKCIVGQLGSSGDHVLLTGLERSDFPVIREPRTRQSLSAEMCLRRSSAFPTDFVLDSFRELRIEMEAFEEWLNLDSIAVDRQSAGYDPKKLHLSCPEQDISAPIHEGTLSIESITTGLPIGWPWDGPYRELNIQQHFYIVFRPAVPSSIVSLRYKYTKLEEFLALLRGVYSRLGWPTVIVAEESSDVWHTLFFDKGGAPAKLSDRFPDWVPFREIDTKFADLYQTFETTSELVGAGYYLYLASLRTPHHYIEDRFFNLMLGIEALHRKYSDSESTDRAINERKRVERILGALSEDSDDRKWLRKKLRYAHEPSLAIRLLESFQAIPLVFGKGEIERFSQACADRRNDIAHAGGPREGIDYGAFHSQIFALTNALSYFYHALLLIQIGVDSKLIIKAMTSSLLSIPITRAFQQAGLNIVGGSLA